MCLSCLQSSKSFSSRFFFVRFDWWQMPSDFFRSIYFLHAFLFRWLFPVQLLAVKWKLQIVFFSFEFGLECFFLLTCFARNSCRPFSSTLELDNSHVRTKFLLTPDKRFEYLCQLLVRKRRMIIIHMLPMTYVYMFRYAVQPANTNELWWVQDPKRLEIIYSSFVASLPKETRKKWRIFMWHSCQMISPHCLKLWHDI